MNNKPQMRELNINDGWEDLVNGHAKTVSRAKNFQVRKMLRLIVVVLSVELVNLALWLFKVIPAVPSLWITETCSIVVAFVCGQMWEGAKR